MKKRLLSLLLAAVMLLGIMPAFAVSETEVAENEPVTLSNESTEDLTQYVDMRYGTNTTSECTIGAKRPNASISPGPDTANAETGEVNDYTGYRADEPILGFSQMHVQAGEGRYGQFLISPQVGLDYALDSHRSEKSNENPGAAEYSVTLDKYGINASYTPSDNSAIYKFTYPEAETSSIVLDMEHCIPVYKRIMLVNDINLSIGEDEEGKTVISGYANYEGWGGWNYIYFYSVINKDFADVSYGTYVHDALTEGSTSLTDIAITDNKQPKKGIGGYISFPTEANEEVYMKIAVSFLSVDKAKASLENEIPDWDYDAVKAETTKIWNETLGKIEVSGLTEEQKKLFYTCLYNTHKMPVYRTGEYKQYGEDIMIDDHVATWDTFRTLYPLYTLTSPKLVEDTVSSYITRLEVNGVVKDLLASGLERPNGNQGGDNVDNIIVEAYLKGLIPEDMLEAAYNVVKNNADNMRRDRNTGGATVETSAYRSELGYIPGDGTTLIMCCNSQLEYCYNDYLAAQMARGLGYEDDYNTWIARSDSWQNIWNESLTFEGFSGFIWPRKADGDWVEPNANLANPGQMVHSWKPYFYEGTPYEYSFFVPHNVEALIEKMGGEEAFIERLIYGINKYYIRVSNQPGFLQAFLFNHTSEPWHTSDYVEKLIDQFTITSPPGCENSGSMSAWYVFANMGIFPSAGQDFYYLTSPKYGATTLNLDNGNTFTIKADNLSETNKYIQYVTLNGEIYKNKTLSHEDITNGGELVCYMGTVPTDYSKGIVPASGSYTFTNTADSKSATMDWSIDLSGKLTLTASSATTSTIYCNTALPAEITSRAADVNSIEVNGILLYYGSLSFNAFTNAESLVLNNAAQVAVRGGVFTGCKSLKTVTANTALFEMQNNVFNTEGLVITVPDNSKYNGGAPGEINHFSGKNVTIIAKEGSAAWNYFAGDANYNGTVTLERRTIPAEGDYTSGKQTIHWTFDKETGTLCLSDEEAISESVIQSLPTEITDYAEDVEHIVFESILLIHTVNFGVFSNMETITVNESEGYGFHVRSGVFTNCDSLETVTFNTASVNLGSNVFNKENLKLVFTAANTAVDSYQSSTKDSQFSGVPVTIYAEEDSSAYEFYYGGANITLRINGIPSEGDYTSGKQTIHWTFDKETGTLCLSDEMAVKESVIQSLPTEITDFAEQVEHIVFDSILLIHTVKFNVFSNMKTVTVNEAEGYGFYIREGVFLDCASLENVTFNTSIVYLREGVFNKENLKVVFTSANTFVGGDNTGTKDNQFSGVPVTIYTGFGTAAYEFYYGGANITLDVNSIPAEGDYTSGSQTIHWTFDVATGTLCLSDEMAVNESVIQSLPTEITDHAEDVKHVVFDSILLIHTVNFGVFSNMETITVNESEGYGFHVRSGVFTNCDSLETVTFNTASVNIGSNVFNKENLKLVFTAANTAVNSYQSSTKDSQFSGESVIIFADKSSAAYTYYNGGANITFATDTLGFRGYSVRLNVYNGLRSIYDFDTAKVKELVSAGLKFKEAGAILVDAARVGDGEITVSNVGGVYTPSIAGAVIKPIYSGTDAEGNPIQLEEAKLLTTDFDGNANTTHFAFTITNFTSNYMSDVYSLGYFVYEDANGKEYFGYADSDEMKYSNLYDGTMIILTKYLDNIQKEELDEKAVWNTLYQGAVDLGGTYEIAADGMLGMLVKNNETGGYVLFVRNADGTKPADTSTVESAVEALNLGYDIESVIAIAIKDTPDFECSR